MSSIDPEADTSPQSFADEPSDAWDHHIELGPFELIEHVGQGGMGEVWRARHRSEGVDVAVKFVTDPSKGDDESRERFEREVRSIASLNHPGIVTVLDYGELPQATERQSSGRLRAGTPYYAMELADEGSLEPYVVELSWPSLRSTLLSLLDALGQAHARGIVHRDLKPSNVLLTRESDGTLRPKISDFGLAFLQQESVDEERERDKACGTPYYMAPEQLKTRWRDYGPRTDLYALGCLAWELTTGRPPYRGDSFIEVAEKHLTSSLPAYRPATPVPPAFERWLRRLLEGHPSDRFQTTAAASWSLLMIDSKTRDSVSSDSDDLADDIATSGAFPTLQSLAEQTLRGRDAPETKDAVSPELDVDDVVPPEPGDEDEVPPLQHRRPPLPVTWKNQGVDSRTIHLLGVGRELFDLREIPMIDRESERQLLWRGFVDSVETRSTRVTLLHGASGRGKTRLARWVRERAHRLGAAHTMMATHTRSNGPNDGLVAALERFFGCHDLDRSEAAEQIERWMRYREIDADRLDCEQLAALMRPESDDEGSHRIPVSSADERRECIRRALTCIARNRPLVLHADDLQWGRSTLEFIQYLLEHPEPDPRLYIVGTLRSDALADRERTKGLIESVSERDETSLRELEPLDERAHRELIRQLLQFEPELSHRLLERSDGNPLFAIQLIKDWVDRDLLTVGEHGFVLREDAEPTIPEQTYDLWKSRLDRLLVDHPDEARVVLELAAALGSNIAHDEWSQLCQVAGVSPPPGLLEDLLRNRLVERTEKGWRFAHDMLRETLEQSARDAERWRDHNRTCAELLEAREHGSELDETYRLGHYYLEAEQYEEAIDPLMRALELCGSRSEIETAFYLGDRLDEAFEGSDLDDDSRRGYYELLKIKLQLIHQRGSKVEALRERLKDVRDMARRHDHRRLEGRALYVLGKSLRHKSEYEGGLPYYEQALERFGPSTEPVEYARTLRAKGGSLFRTGHLDEARTHHVRALEVLDDGRAPGERARIEAELGRVILMADEPEEAEPHLERAGELFRQIGAPEGVGRVLNVLGDIEMARGNLDAACRRFEQALEQARLTHSSLSLALECSLARCRIEKGEAEKARSLLDRFSNRIDTESDIYYRQYYLFLDLQCDLMRSAIDDLERRLEETIETVASALDQYTLEHVDLLAETARRVDEVYDSPLVVELARLAAERYGDMGRDDQAEELCETFELCKEDVLAA